MRARRITAKIPGWNIIENRRKNIWVIHWRRMDTEADYPEAQKIPGGMPVKGEKQLKGQCWSADHRKNIGGIQFR